MNHFHDNPNRSISFWGMMAVLTFVMPQRSLSEAFPNSLQALGPCCHCSITGWSLYTGKNDFSSLVECWEWTAKPLIQVIIYVRYLLIDLSLRFPSTSSTASCHILPRRYSIPNSLRLPGLIAIVSCLRRLLIGWCLVLLLVLLPIIIEVIEHQV